MPIGMVYPIVKANGTRGKVPLSLVFGKPVTPKEELVYCWRYRNVGIELISLDSKVEIRIP